MLTEALQFDAMLRVRIFLVLCFALAMAAAQGQTLYGPGGLIINPTAYSDHTGFFEVNASIFNRQFSGNTTTLYPVSATYALSDRFEFGALYVGQFTGSDHNDMGGAYFKEGLLSETKNRPALALVGTSLMGGGTTSTATLIASKKVGGGLTFHFGGRYVNHSFDSRADGNALVGADLVFARQFRLIAEADTRLNVYRYASAAFGVQWMGPVVVTVGMVNQASSHYSFFFGVGYPVGKP